MPFKFAFLGCWHSHTGMHVRESAARPDEVKLIGAYDSDPVVVAKWREHWDTHVFPSVEALLDSDADAVVVEEIGPDRMGLDIGPDTADRYVKAIGGARVVLFNGPMGVFEEPAFAAGTERVVGALANLDGLTVVGGGDSARAVETFDAASRMSHISTGGGAFLELLAHRTLPGVEVLG